MKELAEKKMTSGAVYWVTGLSGAGKTTIGKELYNRLKEKDEAVVFLDGDILRAIFKDETDFSTDGRNRLSMIYARLCRELSDQGQTVICATISNYQECRNWNKDNISHYHEIYIRVPLEILQQRDSKGIYARAKNGELTNVIGIDIAYSEPEFPNITIDNNGNRKPQDIADEILQLLDRR
jgi:cytidine diphosphoramidate kinase